MPRLTWALAAAALVLPPARGAAQDKGAQHPVPSLVVVITVDQMRGDYLDRFGPQLTGGLARLVRQGTVFSHAYQDHGMTETAPGHATVLSGRNPDSTGIVRNSEGVNDSTPLLEVNGPGASPQRFRGTVLFDWMRARWPDARGLSASRKDRSAILPMGRNKQSVYWYEGGQITTSRYYADTLPAWVHRFNIAAVAARRPGREWNLLLPPSSYPEPDSADYEAGGRAYTFPHRLPDDSTRDAAALPFTPFMDSLTLAFALEGIRQLRLGQGNHPDLVTIGLSATDYIGHTYGPDSREIHDQILRLDRLLGRFLTDVSRGRDGRVLLALTADHGVTPFPEFSRTHGHPDAGYVTVDSLLVRWRDSLTARYGPGGPFITFFEAGMVGVNRQALAARGANVDSVLELIRADLLKVPGMERVDTRASLAVVDTVRDDVARRWRNALAPGSMGELFLGLKDYWVLGRPGGSAQHGQPSELDAHVTLVLWGTGIKAGRVDQRVSVVDIAPTLAQVLGIQPGEPVQGRVLTEALR
jgi:arylsulfatase A-like enzyme